ncbi:MAG: thioredoxin fold domain-containing protein [Gammaproteobacteria bacterium]|nr:thioredoxin fold domain-containing protein [Gammaproteobacteria bacterium]
MLRTNLINHLLLATALIVTTGATQATEEALPKVDIQSVADFAILAKTAKNQKKLIMLEISASYCSYCITIEEELIKPMLRSGDYDNDVLIRKVDIDSYKNLSGFDGQPISGSKLAKMLNIKVTPTLIFLNSENQEVSKRIVGVNSLDYLGAYVDDAIKQGLTIIR